MREKLEKERKTMAEKVETLKKKLSDLQDEFMAKKLEFGREEALAKQQVHPLTLTCTD